MRRFVFALVLALLAVVALDAGSAPATDTPPSEVAVTTVADVPTPDVVSLDHAPLPLAHLTLYDEASTLSDSVLIAACDTSTRAKRWSRLTPGQQRLRRVAEQPNAFLEQLPWVDDPPERLDFHAFNGS